MGKFIPTTDQFGVFGWIVAVILVGGIALIVASGAGLALYAIGLWVGIVAGLAFAVWFVGIRLREYAKGGRKVKGGSD